MTVKGFLPVIVIATVLASALFAVPVSALAQEASAGDYLEPQSSILASGTSGTCSWKIDDTGLLTISPTDGTAGVLGELNGTALQGYDFVNTAPWGKANIKVDYTSVYVSKGVSAGDSFKGAFAGSKITTADLANLDVATTRNFSSVFAACHSLTSFTWPTSMKSDNEIADMNNIFNSCLSLTSIDMTGLNTANVENMSGLFRDCSSLTEIKGLKTLNIGHVKTVSYAFAGCTALTSMDLSGLSLNWYWGSRITDVNGTFKGCTSLKYIDLSDNYRCFYNISQMNETFSGCSNLISVDVEGMGTIHPDDAENLFADCVRLPSIDISHLNLRQTSLDPNTGTYAPHMFINCTNLSEIKVGWGFETYRYDPQRIILFPENKVLGRTGKWVSASTGKTYSSWDIVWQRYYKEDTYTAERSYRIWISSANVSVVGSYSFTGVAITPSISVTTKNGTNKLIEGCDYTVDYAGTNINAGTATGTITGIGDYQGTKTFTFEIQKSSLSSATVTSIPDETYSGSAICPEPAVSLDGTTLIKDTDYTLSYADNVNAGTATITIKGKGKCTGEVTVPFTIRPATLQDSLTYSRHRNAGIYSGRPLDPNVQVWLSDVRLAEGKDYSLSDWSHNIAAGRYWVTITMIGENFAGSCTLDYQISPLPISGTDFTVSPIPNQTYTGSEVTPEPTLKWGSTTLVKGVDYTLSYENNTEPGTAIVTITGTGNFGGTRKVTFLIGSLFDVSEANVSAIPEQSYTGSSICPEPTITYGSAPLTKGSEYTLLYRDNVDVGTGVVIVKGIAPYSGTKEVPFSIGKASLDHASVMYLGSLVYTGHSIVPAFVVRFNGTRLVEGTDFTASGYANNVNAGFGTALITGGGQNFTGASTARYYIIPADFSTARIAAIHPRVYTGSAITPSLNVTWSDLALKAGTDYTAAYSNNVDLGTATVQLTGKGNFDEATTKSATFSIVEPNNVAAAEVGTIATQTYSGAAIEPMPQVVLEGVTLTEGKDYDVTYANNVNAGTATMTITGKGAYVGSQDVEFAIGKADVSKVAFSPSPVRYTGSAATPQITATFGTTAPVAGVDFEAVSYANNVNVGTATATIEGRGNNFQGTTTLDFSIVPADISTATVAAIPDQTWTGSALTPAPAVTWNGLALEEGVDYTLSYAGNVEVGTATVTITGRGNFDGGSSASATFRVAPVDIARASVAAIAARTFTGSAITPATTVTLGGRTLVAGTDYAVDYGSTNVGAGTASGTVTGLGHYGGTCSTRATFAISPASISSATCDPIPGQTYSGSALMPRPAITWNGLTLAGGTDYTLRYENNVNAGTATLTIDGTHNFTGSLKLSFTIGKADISLATFSFDPIAYTGSAVEPVITGSYNDLQLTSGDFTVVYSNNVSAGHGTATVTGMGNNFTGTSSVAFTIDPADISSAAIADIGNQPFTGKACDPPLVITYKGVALVRDTDFTVSYNGTNTSAGTATATIFGRGNYSGTTTKRFNILFSTRLAGQGALDTMAVIVDEAFPSTSDTVVIARDDGYHDALTASGIAGLAKAPVLLVKTNSLPDQTRKEIARLQPKTIIVCGGTSAVSDATAQAAAAVTGASYYRCYGSGAAETASNIFEQGPAITGKNWGKVAFVATNQSYQDALSISPYAYAKGCPIFLASSKTTISDSIVKTIASGGFDQVYVVGGSGVVDPAIVTKLASAGVKVSEANRIWGKGALETSEAIAEWEYDRGMSADNLAIADRDGYWDALSGAALCGSKNTVLLLVEKSNVNKVALNGFASTHKSEIGRAYVLGGALAVPETTRNYLEAILSP